MLSLAMLAAGVSVAADVKPLGRMDGFYRYTAVLGPLLEKGHRLCKIPDWMLTTDFPYEKRPYALEIPFADGLSVVRLLGGWEDKKLPADRRNDPNDLVFRDDAGVLHYRWNLLKARLDPFVTNGYIQLTLVMDNVPYCLAKSPTQGNYGQVAPPGNDQEWYAFIRDMCREMKRPLSHGDGNAGSTSLRGKSGTVSEILRLRGEGGERGDSPCGFRSIQSFHALE